MNMYTEDVEVQKLAIELRIDRFSIIAIIRSTALFKCGSKILMLLLGYIPQSKQSELLKILKQKFSTK